MLITSSCWKVKPHVLHFFYCFNMGWGSLLVLVHELMIKALTCKVKSCLAFAQGRSIKSLLLESFL